ncbi:MAG: VaFE repeat-containing surface-anchored protein, partial [Oscillospiraceae bacterium]|nr:VaFE repeat-containing surface-anchored protein [Oscillospiraceae bacterium]
LYEYVDGKKVLIASHEDPEDGRQQLRIPAIATTAKDTDTGDHVGKVSGSSGIEDTVRYENLRKGEMFRMIAVLADPDTGELLKDSSGSILGTDMYFICSEEEGEITMPEIRIDSRGPEGGSATVQEKLYLVKEGEEILMAAHEDLGDKEQTVTYPQVRTSAAGKDTGDHTAPVSEKTVIEDTVILKGLVPGNEYTLKGRLVYKEDFVDGLCFFHRAGEEIVIRTYSFLAESEETEMVLSFEIDSVLLEGTGAVVFEDLIHNGVTVTSHADLSDGEQSVYFPSVITWASDVKSGTQFVSKGKETVLRDIVQLRGLLPGRSYAVRGQLVNRYSGKPMISDYRSGVFTAEESEMDVIVDMVMDTTEINCFSGVMFESLYLVKEDGTEVLLSSHEDIFDEDQALYLPGISTTATDALSGTHEAQGREKTTIIDEVIYCDLMPLEEYTIEGVLMNAYTGEPVLADGRPVTASVKICPEYPDGSVFLTFLFDAGELAGQKAVVFEKLYWKDHLIASHQDLEDGQQTVNIVDIGTYAKDPDTNTKYLGLDTAVRILDTVKFTGLTPGKTYTLRGSLLYDDGSVVAQYGEPVTSETEFVPERPDGEAEVEFVLDTLTLPGQRLVVYEKLFAGTSAQNPEGDTSPIAVHEDLNDEDQAVFVPDIPEKPVDTGEKAPIGADIALAMASAAGIWWIMTDKKRSIRREEKKRLKELTKKL